MKLAVLVSGGRTGSDLFQSLLDGHKEVLSFPGVFFFDVFLKNLKIKKINPGSLFIKMCKNFFDSRLNLLERHDRLGIYKNEYYLVDKDIFLKKYNEISKKKNLSKFEILLNLHLAYAYAKGEDVSKKKLIFLHIHHWHRLESLKELNFYLFYTIREPLINLSSAFKNWTSYNDRLFSFKQLCKYYERIRNGIDYCQKIQTKDFYVIKLEDIHLNNKVVLKNFCKLFNLKFQTSLYSSTFHNRKWWGDSLSKKYLDGINKNFKSKLDESLFYNYDIKYLKSVMNVIYLNYYKSDLNKKMFFPYRPLKMEIILLKNKLRGFDLFSLFKMMYYSILRYYLLNKKIKSNVPKNIINI